MHQLISRRGVYVAIAVAAATGAAATVYRLYHKSKAITSAALPDDICPSTYRILEARAVRLTLKRCIFRSDSVFKLKLFAYLEHSTLVTEFLNARFYLDIPRSLCYPFQLEIVQPSVIGNGELLVRTPNSLIELKEQAVRRLRFHAPRNNQLLLEAAPTPEDITTVDNEDDACVIAALTGVGDSLDSYFHGHAPLFYRLVFGGPRLTQIVLTKQDVWKFELSNLFHTDFSNTQVDIYAPLTTESYAAFIQAETRNLMAAPSAEVKMYDIPEPSDYFAVHVYEDVWKYRERLGYVLNAEQIDLIAQEWTMVMLSLNIKQIIANGFTHEFLSATAFDPCRIDKVFRPRHWTYFDVWAMWVRTEEKTKKSPAIIQGELDLIQYREEKQNAQTIASSIGTVSSPPELCYQYNPSPPQNASPKTPLDDKLGRVFAEGFDDTRNRFKGVLVDVKAKQTKPISSHVFCQKSPEASVSLQYLIADCEAIVPGRVRHRVPPGFPASDRGKYLPSDFEDIPSQPVQATLRAPPGIAASDRGKHLPSSFKEIPPQPVQAPLRVPPGFDISGRGRFSPSDFSNTQLQPAQTQLRVPPGFAASDRCRFLPSSTSTDHVRVAPQLHGSADSAINVLYGPNNTFKQQPKRPRTPPGFPSSHRGLNLPRTETSPVNAISTLEKHAPPVIYGAVPRRPITYWASNLGGYVTEYLTNAQAPVLSYPGSLELPIEVQDFYRAHAEEYGRYGPPPNTTALAFLEQVSRNVAGMSEREPGDYSFYDMVARRENQPGADKLSAVMQAYNLERLTNDIPLREVATVARKITSWQLVSHFLPSGLLDDDDCEFFRAIMSC